MGKKSAYDSNAKPPETLKAGYILDYISGKPVKATPEEIEAVQPFARRIVEDFNYPKN